MSPPATLTRLGLSRGLGREFNLLWLGQSVSNVGDRINLFVVPTVMILLLHASAFQVGLVGMAQYLAIPLLSLVAGVLVDRWDLRRTLIWCDLIRVVTIAAIPVAYWLDVLSVPLVFAVVALANATSVFFNIGYTATISSIVPADGRVQAFSHLESSRTTAEVVGPAVASVLYRLLGVASLLVDAITFLFSAATVRAMQPYGVRKQQHEPMWTRLVAGVKLNWNDPVLRGTILGTTLLNLGGPIFVTVMPILAYRGLHLSVPTFGTVMSVAAVAAVGGALVAQRVSKKVGPARLMPWSAFLHSAVGLGILAAPALPSAVVLCVTLSLYGLTMVWYNVSTGAVRQARVDPADQAVSHAAFRTITWGVIPFSALLGGVLVEVLTPHAGVLDAARITMVGATLIGVVCAWIPLAPTQARLDRERETVGVA
ncbi:MFS transporter [Couchioplanes azureus]|uniref:MFS transporter n=1 Tax=Couchioplanes caeruleus TaxID=56438 RepID=UPI00166F6EDD|nr:MFS transporter [Couchioplanes caeruleus]GGQ68142.1 MFS transporter [Couchioplanes caeruleus subsp. azureus]